MRQLFAFILKHHFFFLFILLEIFAFSLIVRNNYQRATFLNSTGKITGTVYNTYNNIAEYFTLRKTNNELVDENARLRNSLSQSFLYTDSLIHYEKDSLFKYIGAKVISSTISKQKNYLMIDKGSDHGIHKDMGVITSKGIVGTVVDVSANFSRVMPVLHINNKVNARIKKNRHLGNMEWDGKYYRQGLLTDIPTHVRLSKGDTIISSGNSHIFPEGMLVGTVEDYDTEHNEKFNKALINYSVDFNNLYYVYVITNIMKDEIIELEENEKADE